MEWLERMGYCAMSILTQCTAPEAVSHAKVYWLETETTQVVEVSETIQVKGRGYYQLRLYLKPGYTSKGTRSLSKGHSLAWAEL